MIYDFIIIITLIIYLTDTKYGFNVQFINNYSNISCISFHTKSSKYLWILHSQHIQVWADHRHLQNSTHGY